MKKLFALTVLATVLFGALAQQASSKCFATEDDIKQTESSTDLSSITDFSFSLFKEIFPYKEEKNFFFSPYSIWSAFVLTYFGSKGETERQLKKVLGVGSKIETLKKWRALEFTYQMRQNDSAYIFNIANRAYFDNSVPLNSCVEKILSNELKVVDMQDSGNVSMEINEWVSNTTKGRIDELVSPGDIANAQMVLTNAAFFKGSWQSQFKKSNTKKDIFYTSHEEFSFVDMMVQKGSFRHGKSEALGAHILELPYNGEAVSMLLLLPPFIRGKQGFEAMVNKLNSTTITNALNDMWRVQVEVSLPKFSIEQSVGSELIGSLKKMGINDLFEPHLSNLTEFSSAGGLSVQKSIHKAFVLVTEEGTEAAAATAVISFRVARPVGPAKFVCNHPFLFIIYDNLTNNVLFMGAYKSPKLAKTPKKF